MSFDLYFCRDDKTVPTVEELKVYFERQPSFECTGSERGGSQFCYNNPLTGVYCCFDFDAQVDVEPELSSCAASGLSFNLNYLRPSFFAFETMPLVQSFCDHFKLKVEDPQEETSAEASAGVLIDSWRKHNARAVTSLARQTEEPIDLKYFPEERATAWWSYMRQKGSLESTLTEDIFVPSIFLLETPDKQVISMIVWPDAISQLFPRCDFVLVQRTRKRLFRETKESGLVPYNELIRTIAPLLEHYNPPGEIKYLPNKRKAEASRLFQSLVLNPIDLSTCTRLGSDSFHDVELSIR